MEIWSLSTIMTEDKKDHYRRHGSAQNLLSALLYNEATGASIHVQREDKRWAVDLEDLAWHRP